MVLDKSTTLKFYKRRDIQEAIIKHARDKEVGTRFNESFGKRPDVLVYPRDVIELAIKGLTSFHASEERWSNPLFINSNMSRKELDELRTGWDLLLDIDCAVMEYSRICADLVVRFLKYSGVKDISVKFSGNKGFHIGVPFEAFPKQVGETLTKDLFPEAPKKIALYISEHIKEELAKGILDFEGGEFSKVKEKVGLPDEELIRYENTIPKLNVDAFLEIDTILISSRHLYRMPYSLHEKSGLVSLPIDPEKVLEFEKPMAIPEAVLTPMFEFMNRDLTEESARNLLVQALDFEVKLEEERAPAKKFEEIQITSPITQEFFPQCIKKILNGMEDGKKRAVFILMNFLGKLGWSKEDIKEFLFAWNKKNPEPLRQNYILGQLHHFKPGEKLPPNCDTDGYYNALGLKCDGPWCPRVKNPVNYTLFRWRRHLRDVEEGRIEKKEEEKESK